MSTPKPADGHDDPAQPVDTAGRGRAMTHGLEAPELTGPPTEIAGPPTEIAGPPTEIAGPATEPEAGDATDVGSSWVRHLASEASLWRDDQPTTLRFGWALPLQSSRSARGSKSASPTVGGRRTPPGTYRVLSQGERQKARRQRRRSEIQFRAAGGQGAVEIGVLYPPRAKASGEHGVRKSSPLPTALHEAQVLTTLEHPGIPKLLRDEVYTDREAPVAPESDDPGARFRHALESKKTQACFYQERMPGRALPMPDPCGFISAAAGQAASLAEYGLLANALGKAGVLAFEPGATTHQRREILAQYVGGEVLKILTYLHGLAPCIVHRDIKPANVIVCPETGKVSLVDFGLAAPEGENGQSSPGTLGYMAPEGGRIVDPSADLIAVGCMVGAIARGYSPFDAPTPGASQALVEAWCCAEGDATAKGIGLPNYLGGHHDDDLGDQAALGEATQTLILACLGGGKFTRDRDHHIHPPEDDTYTAAAILGQFA